MLIKRQRQGVPNSFTPSLCQLRGAVPNVPISQKISCLNGGVQWCSSMICFRFQVLFSLCSTSMPWKQMMFHVFYVIRVSVYTRKLFSSSPKPRGCIEHAEHLEQRFVCNYLYCSTFKKDVEQTWNKVGLRWRIETVGGREHFHRMERKWSKQRVVGGALRGEMRGQLTY